MNFFSDVELIRRMFLINMNLIDLLEKVGFRLATL